MSVWRAREANRKMARDADKQKISSLQMDVAALYGELSWWRTWWCQQQTPRWRNAEDPKVQDKKSEMLIVTPMKRNKPVVAAKSGVEEGVFVQTKVYHMVKGDSVEIGVVRGVGAARGHDQ